MYTDENYLPLDIYWIDFVVPCDFGIIDAALRKEEGQ